MLMVACEGDMVCTDIDTLFLIFSTCWWCNADRNTGFTCHTSDNPDNLGWCEKPPMLDIAGRKINCFNDIVCIVSETGDQNRCVGDVVLVLVSDFFKKHINRSGLILCMATAWGREIGTEWFAVEYRKAPPDKTTMTVNNGACAGISNQSRVHWLHKDLKNRQYVNNIFLMPGPHWKKKFG